MRQAILIYKQFLAILLMKLVSFTVYGVKLLLLTATDFMNYSYTKLIYPHNYMCRYCTSTTRSR